jgi:hypothetical protein
MDLRTFLESIEQTHTLPSGRIFCFSGGTYPLLFFYHFFYFLKKHGMHIEHINCTTIDVLSVKALLSTMSFSGTTTYWLENFYILSSKKQQELLEYLQSYTSPHRILFFSEETNVSSVLKTSDLTNIISLSDKMAPHDFSVVRFLVNDNSGNTRPGFTQQIARYTDHLTLDAACLFAHYEVVVGKSMDDFFAHWVTRIIEPTSSLFLLSQHFFAKKQTLFFQHWAIASELYMPSFWATFWADQIWRAYVFCDLMKNKKHAESKKAQYKLPFSFVNRDWSLYTAAELRNAHHFLLALDFKLKNGGSEVGLEYFYTQFFGNKFK